MEKCSRLFWGVKQATRIFFLLNRLNKDKSDEDQAIKREISDKNKNNQAKKKRKKIQKICERRRKNFEAPEKLCECDLLNLHQQLWMR